MADLDRRTFLKAAGVSAASFLCGSAAWARPEHPNIVYILCDDLGYGDIRCLNPDSKIDTSCVDGLAAQGVIFTDAHSGSSVCTPTRYGVMTGRYSWRTTLKSRVLYTNSPPLIDRDRLTVAQLLKNNGYRTACIGKWHLGMTFKTTDGGDQRIDNLDYQAPIKDGPTERGFDYYFGIPASLDMEDYYFIENTAAVSAPKIRTEGEKGQRFHRPGLMAEGFKLEDVLPALGRKAVECIDNHARDHSDKPLFLYLPLSAPHAPIVPSESFKGKTPLGLYGDFVAEIDATVGKVVEALDRNGMTENTLVIFTSDNGCAPSANQEDLISMGHNPNYVFRGRKTDIFEGGHRIPFIAKWPARIPQGASCADTICLVDLMATAADLVDDPLPDNAGEDSVSILPALLNKKSRRPREAVVHHSADGSLAIRQGKWKLAFCPDSGGGSYPNRKDAAKLDLPPVQLYDLSVDIAEKNNVQAQHPDVVKRLTRLMTRYIEDGRSTPGRRQKNEGRTYLYRVEAPNQ